MKRLVLASGSPYRKALLARLCLPFETLSPEVDETPHAGEGAVDLVRRLALSKAHAGAAARPDGLIIGCDQCAVRDAAILGKPGSFEAAFEQLKGAAGRTVFFHTGLCLLDASTGATQLEEIRVTVYFRKLGDHQIRAYLTKESPYSCAASFMSEGLGIALVERIDGDDPTALIGLPLISLVTMLARTGVEVI
jgi:septum formation protein